MHAMGLDIGTTTLSAVVVDADSGAVLESLTVANGCSVPSACWAHLQDPESIWQKARGIVEHLLSAHPGTRCIGLTGQMHGILYADANGRAVSPLFTWQDERGGERMASAQTTYAESLSALTGQNLATGYGAVTHYYNLTNGLIPEGAAWVMTIQDYIGLRLTGRREPLIHDSNAHSFGAPNWAPLAEMIRTTPKTVCLGETSCGVPVAIAIGDNQASFIGSVRSASDSVLVNIGTGGQISVAVDEQISCSGVETRPYIDGGALLVGFSLCGGRAYALLEKLFRNIAALAGATNDSLFEEMNQLAALQLTEPLTVSPLFCGTRLNPSLRGSIQNISEYNLTPAHLVQGMLQGMADELYAPYLRMCPLMPSTPTTLIGSGNGIRRNAALRHLFERAFGMPMHIPSHCEEAAYGASLFALAACGTRPSVASAQSVVQY